MQREWQSMQGKIDDEQYQHVQSLLGIQQKEAEWWRNACVLYFRTFSKKPIPTGLPKPDQDLEYLKNLEFPFAPGIRPRW
jgi:alpha-glucuronidase